MIRRLLTWARRLAGLTLLAWSAYWALESVASWIAFRWLGEPLLARDAETGELYGFQVSPLTPSQRQAALQRELALASELQGA